jgi:hypothetical protein
MSLIIPLKTGTRANIIAIGVAGTACPSALYRATDQKAVWFGAEDGSLIGPFITEANAGPQFYASYANDTEAANNNVPLGGIYFLTLTNTYGGIEGTPKKRTEQ